MKHCPSPKVEQTKIDLPSALKLINLEPSNLQLSQFYIYFDLVLKHWKKFDLVAPSQANQFGLARQTVDSLSVLRAIDFPQNAKIADVGSGAGFPGIPLAIVRPDLQLTLIDAKPKKSLFLQECRTVLKLSFQIIQSDVRRVTEQFDFTLYKAFADLKMVVRLSRRLLVSGGVAVAYKTKNYPSELKKLKFFTGTARLESAENVPVPELNLNTCFLIFRKLD